MNTTKQFIEEYRSISLTLLWQELPCFETPLPPCVADTLVRSPEQLSPPVNGDNNPWLFAAINLLEDAIRVTDEISAERELDLLIQKYLLHEDAYRCSLNAIVRPPSENLLGLLSTLSVYLRAANFTKRRHEALLTFLALKDRLDDGLANLRETTNKKEFEASFGYMYSRCLTSVQRILRRLRLSDYYWLFAPKFSAEHVTELFDENPMGDEKSAEFSVSRALNKESPLKPASAEMLLRRLEVGRLLIGKERRLLQRDKNRFDELDDHCLQHAPTRVVEILDAVENLLERGIDNLDLRSALNALLSVFIAAGSDEDKQARQWWSRTKEYIDRTANKKYRLSKCLGLVDKPLDDNLLSKIKQPSNRRFAMAISSDPLSHGADIDTWIFNPLKTKQNKADSICFVRRWSSASPLVAGSKFADNLFGGGLFLQAAGYGLAIDPGPDFLSNLIFFTPYEFRDLQGVAVTHSHVDHVECLDKILSLSYEHLRNSRFKSPDQDYEGLDLVILESNPDPRKYFDTHKNKCIKGGFCNDKTECNEKGFCKTEFGGVRSLNFLSGRRKGDQRVFSRSDGKSSVDITPVRVKHRFRHNNTSAGLIATITMIETKRRIRIGYTSDTKWFDKSETSTGLTDKFTECDVIVANIATVTYPDLFLDETPKNHLGLTGVIRLLLGAKPKILVLNEWALQNADTDYRLETARFIQGVALENGLDTMVLVAELGLRIGWTDAGDPLVYANCDHGLTSARPLKDVRQVKNCSDLRTLIKTVAPCHHPGICE